jgi:hypothetical protein
MPSLLAQGSPADALVPFICTAVGFVVIPGTLIVWARILQLHRRKIPVWNDGTWMSGLAMTVVCLLWVVAAISVSSESRRVFAVEAMEWVQYQPEVERFIHGGGRRGLEVVHRSHDRCVIVVGDCDDKGHVTTIWNTFAVNGEDYDVSVLVNQNSEKWVPLKQWKELPTPRSQPATQP